MHNGLGETELLAQNPAGTETSQQLKKDMKLSLTRDGTESKLPPPKGSWLLRLFESKLFDMSIAIAYLFNSKEPGVLTYLGNKLFVSTMSMSVVDVFFINNQYNFP